MYPVLCCGFAATFTLIFPLSSNKSEHFFICRNKKNDSKESKRKGNGSRRRRQPKKLR
jgi:hypothetical protein